MKPGFKSCYRLLAAGLLAIACAANLQAAAANPPVQTVSDLHHAALTAAQRGVPILLAISRSDCGYCTRLEEDYLEPMLIGGQYRNKVLIRKIVIDSGTDIVDFDGRARPVSAVADQYHIQVTPTLLFLDGQGHELTQRMVGYSSPDFFGGYLDNAISAANSALSSELKQ